MLCQRPSSWRPINSSSSSVRVLHDRSIARHVIKRAEDNDCPSLGPQEALERHQRLFVWDESGDGGSYAMVEKELALRAQLRGEVQSII